MHGAVYKSTRRLAVRVKLGLAQLVHSASYAHKRFRYSRDHMKPVLMPWPSRIWPVFARTATIEQRTDHAVFQKPVADCCCAQMVRPNGMLWPRRPGYPTLGRSDPASPLAHSVASPRRRLLNPATQEARRPGVHVRDGWPLGLLLCTGISSSPGG
jgi:hypothetical protein